MVIAMSFCEMPGNIDETVKTKILTLLLALVSLAAMPAQVNYAISGNTAYVTRSPNAAGDITIASTFNGYPVTSIEFGAFSGCTGLTNVRIHNRINAIGNSAFSSCTSLTNVTMGDGVTTIENSVFRACTSLANITIPNSVITIREFAFEDCTSLSNVTIPNSVIDIGGSAFSSCASLTQVTIGNSVITIGDLAFSYCANLTNVTIPDSVTSIGRLAFYNCTSLTNITFLGNAPGLADGAFQSVGASATIYYYYGTTGWQVSFGGLPTIMLGAPAPQFGTGTTGVKPGGFGFTVTGVVNQTIVIEASTNLAMWQPVWTNTLSAISDDFVDPQSLNHPRRFYRLRSN